MKGDRRQLAFDFGEDATEGTQETRSEAHVDRATKGLPVASTSRVDPCRAAQWWLWTSLRRRYRWEGT
jgi:hypothetical protein